MPAETLRELYVEDVYVAHDFRQFRCAPSDELVASVREVGIIQPLVVTPDGTGRYVVLSGRTRLAAAAVAGLRRVPCVVRGVSDALRQRMLEMDANIQSGWLPLDIAAMAQELITEHRWTQAQAGEWLAARFGRTFSQGNVSQYLKLLDLPEAAQRFIAERRLDFALAREVSRLAARPDLLALLLAELAAAEPLPTTRQVAARVTALLTPPEQVAEDRQVAQARRVAAVAAESEPVAAAEVAVAAADVYMPEVAVHLELARAALAVLAAEFGDACFVDALRRVEELLGRQARHKSC